MSYSTLVYNTRHHSMMGYLGSNSVLPKRYRNVVTENVEFLNASCISAKIQNNFLQHINYCIVARNNVIQAMPLKKYTSMRYLRNKTKLQQ